MIKQSVDHSHPETVKPRVRGGYQRFGTITDAHHSSQEKNLKRWINKTTDQAKRWHKAKELDSSHSMALTTPQKNWPLPSICYTMPVRDRKRNLELSFASHSISLCSFTGVYHVDAQNTNQVRRTSKRSTARTSRILLPLPKSANQN